MAEGSLMVGVGFVVVEGVSGLGLVYGRGVL